MSWATFSVQQYSSIFSFPNLRKQKLLVSIEKTLKYKINLSNAFTKDWSMTSHVIFELIILGFSLVVELATMVRIPAGSTNKFVAEFVLNKTKSNHLSKMIMESF